MSWAWLPSRTLYIAFVSNDPIIFNGTTTLNIAKIEKARLGAVSVVNYSGPFQGRALSIRLRALIYEDCGCQSDSEETR